MIIHTKAEMLKDPRAAPAQCSSARSRETTKTGLRFSTPRPPKRLTNSEGSKRRPASARRYVLDAQSILTSTAALTGGVDEMAGQTSVKMLRD
jgi:hypothetical protein